MVLNIFPRDQSCSSFSCPEVRSAGVELSDDRGSPTEKQRQLDELTQLTPKMLNFAWKSPSNLTNEEQTTRFQVTILSWTSHCMMSWLQVSPSLDSCKSSIEWKSFQDWSLQNRRNNSFFRGQLASDPLDHALTSSICHC